jgi:AmpD protein
MTASPVEPSGWLRSARRCPSPNFDQRSLHAKPELLVVHCISLPAGRYGGPYIDALFQNRLPPGGHPSFPAIAGLRVSAHLLIDRRGRLTQYVALPERAWHAGVSEWNGRTACNDFSIGVELEGIDGDRFSEMQYQALAEVTRALQLAYPSLKAPHIAGHDEIAPGRKRDPGPGFDWSYFCRMLGVDNAQRRALLSAIKGEKP